VFVIILYLVASFYLNTNRKSETVVVCTLFCVYLAIFVVSTCKRSYVRKKTGSGKPLYFIVFVNDAGILKIHFSIFDKCTLSINQVFICLRKKSSVML